MRVGVIGCCHGELNRIYSSLPASGLDLLLICGDFQALRNSADLESFCCPPKYRRLGDFHDYYSGAKKAPVLTIFVGGNHEASNYLWEQYYGGFVANNIYFLGYSGIVNVGPLRIGGISGIYNEADYEFGYSEKFPYRRHDLKSIYHTRSFETFKLSQIKKPLDIFISHDWPKNIAHCGDLEQLLENKPFFKTDIKTGKLGSPALESLMTTIKPNHWFSAHLHVKFEATVRHAESETKFLALDKCLPRRKYLEVLEIGPPADKKPVKIKLDSEWLAILKSTHSFFPRNNSKFKPPKTLEYVLVTFRIPDELIKSYETKKFKIRFYETAVKQAESKKHKEREYRNPHTQELCDFLGITNLIPSSNVKIVGSGESSVTAVDSTKDLNDEDEVEDHCCMEQDENQDEIKID